MINNNDNPQIIIEIKVNGNFAKVTAIDEISGEEATIIGDLRAGRQALAKLAIKRLRQLQQLS